ncbi:MAG: ribosome biogenesis GTPase Der [Dehalococcoidia bacterium]
MRKPVVAIVGRPNVGKSALFNRLIGSRKALVEDIPGTTRDRVYADVEWGEQAFTLIDTGGLEPSGGEGYTPLVKRQVEVALAEADVIVLVVDARDGLTATDFEIADLLRQAGKPLLLVANKADNEARRQATVQFYELALGEPIPVSAYHGLGLSELMDRLALLLPAGAVTAAAAGLRLAIVGRPNVGKSLLLNAILGQERVIVSEEPGTTRDAIDITFRYRDQDLVLIDTAGIRRRGRIQGGVEKHSVLRAQEAIDRADVALLVTDASEGIAAQDTHIAGYVAEVAKGLVIAINKWDLMPQDEETRAAFAKATSARLRFVPWAPLCFVSAKEGTGIADLLDAALAAAAARDRRVATAELNAAVRRAVAAHGPPSIRGQRLKVLYVTQAQTRPPTFVFFVNDPTLLHFSYRRYLENSIRKVFGFQGTALRLIFRGRGEG